MLVIAVVTLDIVAKGRCYKEVVRAGFIKGALLQTVLTGTGGLGRWWWVEVGLMRGEGGGKRWMKFRGNEEIKIGRRKYQGEVGHRKKKNPSIFLNQVGLLRFLSLIFLKQGNLPVQ